MIRPSIRSGLCALLAGFLAGQGARGQTYILWDGGGTNNNWSFATNWNPDVAPPNPTTNYINLAGTTRLTPVVNSNWTILGLFISNNAGGFTLSGSNLTITASQLDQNAPFVFEHRGPSNVVVNNNIIIPASTNARRGFLLNSAASATFNGMITNTGVGNAGLWFRASSAGGAGAASSVGTLNNKVYLGTNKFSKLDGVTWVIGTNGNEWGDTDIYHTGVLRIAAANAIPTNSLVTFAQAQPGGRLDLNNFNQTVAGLSALAQPTAVPAVSLGAGAGGTLTINSSLTNVFHGRITENGSLAKFGTGRQILMTNSTFTGSVLVAEGVLQLGTNRGVNYFNAVGASPAAVGGRVLTIRSGATLDNRGRDVLPNTMQVVINGTLTNEAYTMIGPVVMGGGRIEGGNGLNTTHKNLAFRYSVTVTGTTPSVITGMSGVTNEFHLENSGVVFDVRDVTGDAAADLLVSGVLGNISPNATGVFGTASGGLLKTGTGKMLLDQVNTFSGTGMIQQGTLALSSTGLASLATITVGTGGVFDVSAYPTYTIPASQTLQGFGSVTGASIQTAAGSKVYPGLDGQAGSLTLNAASFIGRAGFTNVFDLTNNLTVGGGNDYLMVTGGPFFPTNSIVRINPLAPLVQGDYRLISYAGTNSSSFGGLLGNTTRDSWTLTDTTTGQVFLTVASGTNQSLTWTAQNSDVWDLATTTNWTTTPGAVQDAYYNLDTVIFDDQGANSNVVNLTTTVKPSVILVNSSSNYVLQGVGRIESYAAVPGLFTKDGPGSFTLAVPLEFFGPTVVSNGTLQVGNGGLAGSVGNSAITVQPSGTLAYLRSDSGASPYVLSNVIAGAGTLNFLGVASNNLSVYQPTNNNAGFTGQINIRAAKLQPQNPAALGNGSINVISGDGTNGSGQLFLLNAGTYTNPITAAGIGFMDSVTNHGAIRLRSGATLAGTLTLTNNARVGVFDAETGNLAGPVSGPYELEFFGRNAASLITVGSPVAPNYAATRISGGTNFGGVVLASNANAFSTGPMTLNGGTLRMNGNSFAFSNLSSTVVGGVIENRSTTSPATLTAGTDDSSTTFVGYFQNGSTQSMNLTKVGAGALTVFNNAATGTATASAGTLVISNGSWSGPLVVSSGATVVALGGQGLLGQYYPVAPVVSGSNHVNIGFLPTFNRYLAAFNPNLLYQSTAGTLSNSFHFGTTGANFPPAYSAAAANFQGRWVGKFNATNAGAHSFSTGSDDGSAIFINGALVVSNGFNQGINVPERTGTVTLAVGLHDIVVAFGQATGGYGLFANVVVPGGTKQPLLNTQLSSGPGVGSLGGSAGSMLVVSNGLLTIAQNLNTAFSGDISGNGGLQKIGTGTLTLDGANTYTDATVVASGELVVNGGIASTAPLTVQPGARLSGIAGIGGPASAQDNAVVQAGTLGTVGTLTFSNDLVFGALVTNVFDFNATTNDLFAVSGQFTPSNATIFINPSAALANGLYPIVTYGTLIGGYDPTVFNLNPIASGVKRLSLDYATANEIRLAVGAGKTLTWNSPTSGIWDVQISSHWKDGLAITNEVFFQGDAVLFDDTPGVTQIVSIASNTAVWPAAITVNTSTNAFTLNINGSLNGNFALVKEGTNTFTLSDGVGFGINQNLGSGGVLINNGILRLVGQNDGGRVGGTGLHVVNPAGILQSETHNTLGQQITGPAPLLVNGGIWRPAAFNHLSQLTIQSNGSVQAYTSDGGDGIDLRNFANTAAVVNVIASTATVTNAARMSILNSATNTLFNIENGPADIDAIFSGRIAGSTTRFFVMTNTGTLLLSGPGDNNNLGGIIENGTLLLGKTGATIRAIGANPGDGVILRGNNPTVRIVGPSPDQIFSNVGVRVDAGTLDLNGFSEGFGHVNGNGGTILNNAAGTTVTNVIGENSGNGVYGGIIQNGAGVLALAKAGTGSQTLTNANTYTGGTVIRAGTLVLSNSLGNALVGNVQIGVGSANSVLLSGFSEQIPDSSFLSFSSGGAGTSGKLQLMGNTETVAGISILAGTISLIQNQEGETVNTDGRFVLNNDAANVSLFENNIIRDRSGGTGTGKLSVVKAGAGILVLSGTLTHSGPTILSNGTLAINSALTASPVTLDGGTFLGTGTISMPFAANAGSTVQPGYAAFATPLTLSSTSTLAAGSALSLIANGTGAILRVNGANNLVIPSVGTVAVGVGPVPGTGTYAVVDYAGAIQGGTVSANLALTPYPRTAATLVDNTTNTTIDLVVTALGEAIKWTGAADGIWNINTTTNWQTQTGLLPTAYLQPATIGDSVLFDDSASGNFTISIPAGVNPSALAVSNSANDYTWTGAAIGGGSGLTKDGIGKLTILTTNTFGGATVIQAGTLAIAADSSLGLTPGAVAPSQLVIGAGAEIEYLSSMTVPANRGIVLGSTNGGGVSTFDTAGNTVTIPFALINNGAATGGLGKTGSGELVLSASNRFTGPVSIQGGTVRVGALGALGPILSNTVTIANGGQVNLNGINQTGNNYAYTIAGAGPDGNGAIINTNTSIGQNSTVRWLNLADHATVGAMITFGTPNENGRIDLGFSGHIEGNGYTLTKTGHAPMGMRGTSSNLQLVINQGMVYVENFTNGIGTNVIVNTTGYVAAYGALPGRRLSVPVTLNGGTLASRHGANAGVVTWEGPVALTADSFLATRSISYPAEEGLIVAGSITGTNALTILGTASNVVLTGSNTYSGGTTIHGRLQIGTNGPTGSIVGNIVDNNQLIIQRAGLLELGGDISGTGTVIVANGLGGGTVVLGGTNTFTGNVDVQSGSIVALNSQSLGVGTKTIFLSNGTAGGPNLTIDGTGGNITFASNITFQTSWNAGASITNKAGDNVINGPFTLTSGGGFTLIKSAGGSLTLNGTMTFNQPNRVLDLGGASTGTVNGAILAGGQAGVGLVKSDSGIWTINNSNNLNIATVINAGTLQVGSGGTAGSLNTNAIVNNGILAFNRSDVFTNAGVISGSGTLVQQGPGTLVLHALETYTGPTFVSNGALIVHGSLSTGAVTVATGATLGGTGVVNGPVTSSGTVAPGASAGLLTLNNGYAQNSTGALAIELGGISGGVDHDQLLVPTQATLDGALNVTFLPGYTGTVGSAYSILIASTINGTFATTNLPVLAPTNAWNVEYTANSIILSITNVPPTGYDAYALQITNGLTGIQDDADADGYANLLEYVFGSNPTNPGNEARLFAARTNGLFALKFVRATNSTDATLIVEGAYAASNNTEWIGFATNIGGSWGSATNVIETGGPDLLNVTAFDIVPAATNRFLRLKVTRP